MTASAESSTSRSPSSSAADTAAIDASCRWPVLALFMGAAFWLVVSSAFGLIASLKFHEPDFLADSAALSYGRAYAVWADALVYGFCVPSALAFTLWIIARLGRVPLKLAILATAGGKLWHLGIFFGLIGILRGGTTGYEWFELPRYATLILLGSFLLIAICAFMTHANRTERALQPAHWFALASLFWFPWILSTAILLLQCFPVRGAAQAAIAWWYSGNLLTVWLALAGLAGTFYLLPKLVQRPLQSSYTALFTFWTLILFGTWTGIQGGVAVPAGRQRSQARVAGWLPASWVRPRPAVALRSPLAFLDRFRTVARHRFRDRAVDARCRAAHGIVVFTDRCGRPHPGCHDRLFRTNRRGRAAPRRARRRRIPTQRCRVHRVRRRRGSGRQPGPARAVG